MKSRKFLFLPILIGFVILINNNRVEGQNKTRLFEIGAQVWVEPGQTKEEIENWFAVMEKNHLTVARMFILWNYVEPKPGQFDFSMYDIAFDAAAKHNVKIVATLAANHGPAHTDEYFYYKAQDGRALQNQEILPKAEKYIAQTVNHYKNHKALDTWMLQNEPGQLDFNDPLGISRFKEWLTEKYKTIEALNNAWLTWYGSFNEIEYNKFWKPTGAFVWPTAYYDWEYFQKSHLTWYLKWIATNIKKHDTQHNLHVNPHGLFDILSQYELPEYRTFLSSFGASIHPSWHFEIFTKEQYPLAVSSVCDIIKGASGNNPFWITELQGGNNLYSGTAPLCPTKSDINNWVWSGIGSGAERVIFWCLNWRRTGGEAGEWSLLNFQNQPSERLLQVKQIMETIHKNKSIFEDASAVKSNITLVFSPESMINNKRKDVFKDLEGRKAKAHIKSLLGYYLALKQMGITPNIKYIDDFEWEKAENQLAILPHVTALSEAENSRIKLFAKKKSNNLLITGLTGFFDHYENNLPQTGFYLKNNTGAEIKEVIYTDDNTELNNKNKTPLPFYKWFVSLNITEKNTKSIYTYKNQVAGVKNHNSIYIPSLIGLQAFEADNSPLINFLKTNYENTIATDQTKFGVKKAGEYISVTAIKNQKNRIIVMANGGKTDQEITPIKDEYFLEKNILFGAENLIKNGTQYKIKAGGTLVCYTKE